MGLNEAYVDMLRMDASQISAVRASVPVVRDVSVCSSGVNGSEKCLYREAQSTERPGVHLFRTTVFWAFL